MVMEMNERKRSWSAYHKDEQKQGSSLGWRRWWPGRGRGGGGGGGVERWPGLGGAGGERWPGGARRRSRGDEGPGGGRRSVFKLGVFMYFCTFSPGRRELPTTIISERRE
uniref:Uncharacterized protein n=1 Tax=Aegilops tauschii subsp. strangulata TaxID=200361 RepID=A0A452XTL4_AEGTS